MWYNPVIRWAQRKYLYEVNEMKFTKIKAAAIVMAAATAICAGQAMSASAAGTAFQYTSFTQTQAESQSRMNTVKNAWKNNGWNGVKFKANASWNQTATLGVTVGPGFSSSTPSGNQQGATLSGSAALARKMAESYFDTTIFIETYANGKYYSQTLGDQLTLTNYAGTQTKTVFVTQVAGGMKVTELQNGKIKYDIPVSNCNGTIVFNNDDPWLATYVTRPIKQGDANGDGVVLCHTNYYIWGNDLTYLGNYCNGNYANNFTSNPRTDVLFAACSFDHDWSLNYYDYDVLQNDQADGSDYTYTYRMNGNFGYVKRLW